MAKLTTFNIIDYTKYIFSMHTIVRRILQRLRVWRPLNIYIISIGTRVCVYLCNIIYDIRHLAYISDTVRLKQAHSYVTHIAAYNCNDP